MNRAILERSAEIDASFQVFSNTETVYKEHIDLRRKIAKEKRLTDARLYYAASKIQACIRGFLDRVLYKNLSLEQKAAIIIQKSIRRKLGRIKARLEYYKKYSVVKSQEALDEILIRSNLIREVSGARYHWQEYYDPLSDQFWYYNARTKQNIWDCPLPFQRTLVCTWAGGYDTVSASKINCDPELQKFLCAPCNVHMQPCRHVFSDVVSYQNHLRTAHKWACPACSFRNTGASYPKCALCSNSRHDLTGEDMSEVFAKDVTRVQNKLYMFLVLEKATQKDVDYNLKESLISVALRRRDQRMQMQWNESLMLALNGQDNQEEVIKRGGTAGGEDDDKRDSFLKLPPLNAEKKSKKDDKLVIKDSRSKVISKMIFSIDENGAITTEVTGNRDKELQESVLSLLALEQKRLTTVVPEAPLLSSVRAAADAKDIAENSAFEQFVLEKLRDPIAQGNIPLDEFDIITKHRADDTRYYFADNSSAETGYESDDGSPRTKNGDNNDFLINLMKDIGKEKLLVCPKFMQKPPRCKLVCSCPLAHPGVRDTATIYQMRIPGDVKKVQYVKVCQTWLSNAGSGCTDGTFSACPNGRGCLFYHMYVRPSTEDIIAKLYQKEEGTQKKVLQSGAKFEGMTKAGAFHGYGVFTWPGKRKATYIGNFARGERSGFGVYRDSLGIEYVGEWTNGMRHGFGILSCPNGEEYVGDWKKGLMDGMGRLVGPNGDIYEGEFRNHKYHGIGLFLETSTGNSYLGSFQEGIAHGLGILKLQSKREVYKGFFDKNVRHGKGVCSFRNGGRYAGNWYRGVPCGFGVYIGRTIVDNTGVGRLDKYVGQWEGGMKHGSGRYFYSSGDFYDGEFYRDRARGSGIYYHSNGNIYKGQWEDDKRHGIGTYIFANGSRFTGHWKLNRIDGKGKFDYVNGCFYKGEFSNSRKNGKGCFTWSNGNCYKGMFKDDEMVGSGEMSYCLGHKYIGNWEKNMKNGFGIFHYSGGHRYEGSWLNDIRHGKGKIVYFEGMVMEEEYDGDWDNDERHGFGKYIYRKGEGVVYEGQWVRGRRNGKGKISFKDGSYYRGDFKDDYMWGTGVYVDATENTQYDGHWYKNMRQGPGALIDRFGNIFSGEFWQNMKHGKGKMHNHDGTTYEGRWEGNLMKGTGVYNLQVGETNQGAPIEIGVKVFAF